MLNHTQATDKRQTAAVALVEQHLTDIKAHHSAPLREQPRGLAGRGDQHDARRDPGPVTCDCPDFQHRHPEGGCKHIAAR